MYRVSVHGTYDYYSPGYGLHLFGTVMPFPPPGVLWAMAVLDVAATLWAWRHPGQWPVLVLAILVSAYLTVVGVFSIGPLYFVLLAIQLGRLVTMLRASVRKG
ncbi:MAG: hypothetical protein K6V97_14755 [Actinomycetia bacterium]|nr:hypothetical protein [Actinomycetes bacterium]